MSELKPYSGCPKCHEKDRINDYGIQFESESEVTQSRYCFECGYRWVDIFRFTGSKQERLT